jgi:hypothetical protein
MLVSWLRGGRTVIAVRLILLAAGLACVSALLLVCDVHPVRAATQPQVNEYMMLIDTSKSMAGYEGSQNIFPAVKKAVRKYVEGLPLGSVVYINTFDSQLTKRPPVRLQSPADKRKVEATVSGLTADGMTTAIYNALSGTLDELQRVSRVDPGTVHNQNILLFTDGKDNQSGMSFQEIARQFKLARAENPNLYLTYVSLGTTADPRWSDVDGVTQTRDPPAMEIHSVAVKPAALNYGSLHDSDASQPQTVQITFDKGLVGVSLGLTVTSAAAEAAGGLVSLEPSVVELRGTASASGSLLMTQNITLHVQNRAALDQSKAYAGKIGLTLPQGKIILWSPRSLAFRFTLAAEPQIALELAGGKDGKLGKLDPYASSDDSVRQTLDFAASFNSTADAAGSTVTVRLEPGAGTAPGAATLQGADGPASDGIVELTATQPTCSLVVEVQKGQAAGKYAYDLLFEPSEGVVLSGLPVVDAATGTAVLAVSFAVPSAPPPPPPPEPLSTTIVRWLIIALIVLLVVLLIAFFGICLITHTGPGGLLRLIGRRLSPKLKDARVDITAPVDSIQQVELTGQKSCDVGPERIPALPFTLRFEPHVAVLSGTDEAVVRVYPSSDFAYFMILHATTGIEEPTSSSAIANGDVIRIDTSDGRRCEFVFQSFDYMSV